MLRFEDAQAIVNAAIAEHRGDRWTDSSETLKQLAKKLADAARADGEKSAKQLAKKLAEDDG
jgi:hypothetical protein